MKTKTIKIKKVDKEKLKNVLIKEIEDRFNALVDRLPEENNSNFNRNSIISLIKNEVLIFKKSKGDKNEI